MHGFYYEEINMKSVSLVRATSFRITELCVLSLVRFDSHSRCRLLLEAGAPPLGSERELLSAISSPATHPLQECHGERTSPSGVSEEIARFSS